MCCTFVVCEMLLSGTAHKKDAACLASRDPNQASCPRFLTCECCKDPFNKCMENSFRLVLFIDATFGERKLGIVYLDKETFKWRAGRADHSGADHTFKIKTVNIHPMIISLKKPNLNKLRTFFTSNHFNYVYCVPPNSVCFWHCYRFWLGWMCCNGW